MKNLLFTLIILVAFNNSLESGWVTDKLEEGKAIFQSYLNETDYSSDPYVYEIQSVILDPNITPEDLLAKDKVTIFIELENQEAIHLRLDTRSALRAKKIYKHDWKKGDQIKIYANYRGQIFAENLRSGDRGKIKVHQEQFLREIIDINYEEGTVKLNDGSSWLIPVVMDSRDRLIESDDFISSYAEANEDRPKINRYTINELKLPYWKKGQRVVVYINTSYDKNYTHNLYNFDTFCTKCDEETLQWLGSQATLEMKFKMMDSPNTNFFIESEVQEDPVQEDPVQEDPVQEDPVQEDPVQEDPVQEDPVQEELVQEEADALHKQLVKDIKVRLMSKKIEFMKIHEMSEEDFQTLLDSVDKQSNEEILQAMDQLEGM